MLLIIHQPKGLYSLAVGLIFVILVSVLLAFLREINHKSDEKSEGFFKRNPVSGVAIVLLTALLAITVCCRCVTQIDFPETVNVVQQENMRTQ